MATFYLLPPRVCLEAEVGKLCARLLPGLAVPVDAWDALARSLGEIANWRSDVFLIPQDELPDGSVAEGLVEGFGAEAGDRVVEVSLTRPARAWVLTAGDVSAAAPAR
ncbi:MAG: hypothetical protein K2V38_01525 [Gemmataceae bacterium]|nr:hypothetical protein [Gemmataceae bacterium]